MRHVSSYTVTVVYSPSVDVDRAQLERLVEVAGALRTMTGAATLYESVRLVDDGQRAAVEFVVPFARDPQYGRGSLAVGLVGRALSDAGLRPGRDDLVARI